MTAIKSGKVGGLRNPKGEPLDLAAIADVRPALMPSQGRGKEPRYYRNVEEVELDDGRVVARCKDEACIAIAFKSASAAAQHRGAAHPGQSPRGPRPAKAVEPAAGDRVATVADAVEILTPKPRRGRPPADPVAAQEAFLDLVARSTAGSIGEFLDQVIASRERAIVSRNGAQQEAVRLRQTLLEVQHHVNRINDLIQGISG